MAENEFQNGTAILEGETAYSPLKTL